MGMIFLILGILGILLGGLITIISLLLPQMTRNVSPSEASIGIVGGILLLIVSFIPAIIGIVIMIMKKKKKAPQA
jgi:hypothetical protein